MSSHTCRIAWERRSSEPFVDNQYSRAHTWTFDGGFVVPASSSPHVVPVPLSSEHNVDPEEALVAALSSCHMLVFLYLAAGRQYAVDAYIDAAVGIMAPNEDGHLAITEVTLQPVVTFGGPSAPTMDDIARLHEHAHQKCFIANSVKTIVRFDLSRQRGSGPQMADHVS